jgi:hypothetical protein
MANKIPQRPVELQRSASADDLKHIFEAAVCELHHPDMLAPKNPQYRMPIVQRRSLPNASPASAEKRAMSDAARALAQLWKVSAHVAR